MNISFEDKYFRLVLIGVAFALATLLSERAGATPPPEELPDICVQTLCLSVIPGRMAEVLSYSSSLDVKSGRQFVSVALSEGVVINFASHPVSMSSLVGSDFQWDRRSPTLVVASSCILCAESRRWKGQAIGISIESVNPRLLDSFLSDASINIWSLSMEGGWNGDWRDLPLSRTYNVRLRAALK